MVSPLWNGVFKIQTKLHKSKIHGMVRVWGKFPSDTKNYCGRYWEHGLGLICKYANGLPTGKCWKGLIGGAWIYGEMADDGEFSGRDIAYINQDMSIGYKGIFYRGIMMNASVVRVTGEHCSQEGMKLLRFSKSTSYHGIKLRYKRPDTDSIGDQPFVVDPLDNKYIELGQSSIDTCETSQEYKENGAFAKVDIPPQTVISHHNGYIVNGDERDEWINKQFEIIKTTRNCDEDPVISKEKIKEDFKESLAKYRTHLRCDEFLEIPSEIGQTKSKYRSSWGHKINHCFARQNSRLQLYDSARFGVVMGIKVLNEISILKGQELFLHYGYSYSAGPKWYKDSFHNFLMEPIGAGRNLDLHWQQIRNNLFSEANITKVADASIQVLDNLLKQYQDYSNMHT